MIFKTDATHTYGSIPGQIGERISWRPFEKLATLVEGEVPYHMTKLTFKTEMIHASND